MFLDACYKSVLRGFASDMLYQERLPRALMCSVEFAEK